MDPIIRRCHADFGGRPRFFFALASGAVASPASSDTGSTGLGFLGGLPRLRLTGGSPEAPSSSGFLGCEGEGKGGGGIRSVERARYALEVARHTLGGLPRFLFSPVEGPAAIDVGGAAAVALFLFLLPLGRPRERFTGGVVAESALFAPIRNGRWSWRDRIRRVLSINKHAGWGLKALTRVVIGTSLGGVVKFIAHFVIVCDVLGGRGG